jgi:hypothetical protein
MYTKVEPSKKRGLERNWGIHFNSLRDGALDTRPYDRLPICIKGDLVGQLNSPWNREEFAAQRLAFEGGRLPGQQKCLRSGAEIN